MIKLYLGLNQKLDLDGIDMKKDERPVKNEKPMSCWNRVSYSFKA